MTNNHVVYCSSVGYQVYNDTGKRFRFESEANYYVIQLRRNGHHAWAETLTPELVSGDNSY